MSSLPLQTALFFNVSFSILYALVLGILEIQKLQSQSFILLKSLSIVLLSILVVCDIVRLKLGFVGNLMDRLPELIGFLILTCPVILICVWFCVGLVVLGLWNEMEVAFSVVYLIMLCVEFVFGVVGVKILVRSQSRNFMLME